MKRIVLLAVGLCLVWGLGAAAQTKPKPAARKAMVFLELKETNLGQASTVATNTLTERLAAAGFRVTTRRREAALVVEGTIASRSTAVTDDVKREGGVNAEATASVRLLAGEEAIATSVERSAPGDWGVQAERVGEDIRTLYPETWESFDLDDVLAQSDQWLAQSRASVERAMEAEARAVQAIERTQGRIDRALTSSSGAEGQTGAIQAGNQLLGIQASQLAEIQALLVAQSRAMQTERMERIAREGRARELQRRAFPAQTTAPAPANSAFED